MPYNFNTPEDTQAMLSSIGADTVEELFDSIPEALRLRRLLNLPPAMTEIELSQHMGQLADKNLHSQNAVCFLGGGSYDHFIPAAVDALASRGEFYTSYTPYQPEVSQGNLQCMFEYQTLICQLTGMDVSNASLYDGGSAVTEAALMALSVSRGRKKVIVPDTVHPEYRQILETYLQNIDAVMVCVPCPSGVTAPEDLASAIDDETACVVVQHPNFFGCLEDVEKLAAAAHEHKATCVVSADPMSLGILRRPGDLGADIVVAEGQGLGNPMSYGGPYLGIMACKDSFLRRMPGRIAGQTVDHHGQTCWVLTMQTREQHIRRDKATSNICTNQGLFALRASIYLALLGPQGLREVGTLCAQKANYAANVVTADSRFTRAFSHPTFKEFVVRDRDAKVQELLENAESHGVLAGVPLGQWYPHLEDCLLVAVTEQRTKQQIDQLNSVIAGSSQEALTHA